MSRQIKPATFVDKIRMDDVLINLREALDMAKQAGCLKTAERIRAAIASAAGARRHLENRIARTI